jgi:hypothetical protein
MSTTRISNSRNLSVDVRVQLMFEQSLHFFTRV